MPAQNSYLRYLREKRKLSLDQLADAAGLSKTAVHGLESGRRRGSPETIAKLAAALEVPEADLTPPPNWDQLHSIAKLAATEAILNVTAGEK